MNATREVGNYKAASARLHYKGTGNTAWCAPTDSTNDVLEVDLGTSSNITMIATQGVGREPILQYTKEFRLEYSNDRSLWKSVTEDGSGSGPGQVFIGNKGANSNDDVFYNKLKHVIFARYVRVIPIQWQTKKCLRFELYGQREIDECQYPSWNICDKTYAKCTDRFAAYKCHCITGYSSLTGLGALCLEIDECSQGTHNCSRFASCDNNPAGSFTCTCNSGYHGDGYYCEDINECQSSPCHVDADCLNLEPFYRCLCKAGFAGDGKSCTDIDECSEGTHNCNRMATCTNTKGSFKCTCNQGWLGNGRLCQDADECQLGTHSCHQFAVCTNNQGSYRCDCIKDLFKGDGFYCHDVDECSLGKDKHKCKESERCYNLVGSHKCQCPKEIPMQSIFIDTETLLFGKIADELSRVSEEDSDNPIDDLAQKMRTIYQLAKNVYSYHFKETIQSFYTVHVSKNKLALEMYDFRCTDVKKMTFPNHCHSNYSNEQFWTTITDKVDVQFVGESTVAFEQWATPPPSTQPPTTAQSTATSFGNSTNVTTTQSPNVTMSTKVTEIDWSGKPCKRQRFIGNRGHFSSPLFPNYYPLNTMCEYLIEVDELRDVYINFTYFQLEKDRKCAYDNVRIYDGTTENNRLIAQYCGSDGLPVAVRSSGRYMLVVFRSDSRYVMRGFNATWVALEPRVSVTCMLYNPLSYTSDPELHTKYLARIFEADRTKFIPISRMMACVQYPQCNVSLPKPVEFTFEHTINDREEKQCIHWNIDAFGTTWSPHGCTLALTNKTHTVCKCWPYGIVAVLGRDRPYFPPPKPKIAFKLGNNCLISLILVVLTLIGTLIFLTFKDNWIPYFMTILIDKDYDSGRIIQMHVVLNVLITEMVFSSVTFHMQASPSRISPIFDSRKYNSYKIYLAMGYGIPFLVTLTVTGLNFKRITNERMCWILFNGTTVWGYSGSVCTLAMGSVVLLLVTIYHANSIENGILLQEKCLKNMFTTVFCLFAAVFGARAVQTGQYGAQYLFSLCNILQCFSILLIYCILTREQPMVQTNKVAPSDEPNEPSGLGMLAEIAMKKHQEEMKKVDLDNLFSGEVSPDSLKGFKGKSADYRAGSRAESGIASQSGEDSDSGEEDREDGRIHFRFDEYQQMKEIEQMELQQQQYQETNEAQF
eukprot:gene986-10759_t